jgi:hypothetical protein
MDFTKPEQDDPIARFLTGENQFSKTKNKVKMAAFMPPNDLQLSVFQIKALTTPEIWLLGEEQAAQPSGRTLHGQAILLVKDIGQVKGLQLVPDNDPLRHASIVGWSEDKALQKIAALDLADRATLVIKP